MYIEDVADDRCRPVNGTSSKRDTTRRAQLEGACIWLGCGMAQAAKGGQSVGGPRLGLKDSFGFVLDSVGAVVNNIVTSDQYPC